VALSAAGLRCQGPETGLTVLGAQKILSKYEEGSAVYSRIKSNWCFHPLPAKGNTVGGSMFDIPYIYIYIHTHIYFHIEQKGWGNANQANDSFA